MRGAPLAALRKGDAGVSRGRFVGLVSVDADKHLHVEFGWYAPSGDDRWAAGPRASGPWLAGAGAGQAPKTPGVEAVARGVAAAQRDMAAGGRVLWGALWIERSGFSLAVKSLKPQCVDEEAVELLRTVHEQARLPALGNDEGGTVPVQFEGGGPAATRFLKPGGTHLHEVFFNVARFTGEARGVVCNADGVASFHVLESSLSDEGAAAGTETSVDRETLELVLYAAKRRLLDPLGFFGVVARRDAFRLVPGWDVASGHPLVVMTGKRYDEFEDELGAEKVAQFVEVDLFGDVEGTGGRLPKLPSPPPGPTGDARLAPGAGGAGAPDLADLAREALAAASAANAPTEGRGGRGAGAEEDKADVEDLLASLDLGGEEKEEE
ncbi:MAG: hypothetical protein Kow0069_09020 [Promethearchaeota archaeon]